MEHHRDVAPLVQGRYRARILRGMSGLSGALALRAQCFRGGRADADAFDPVCRHVVIEEVGSQRVVCTCRLLFFDDGRSARRSYAAQFYDLSTLDGYRAPLLEVGRFCMAADCVRADVLRVAWGAMTRQVDALRVGMLFGCSSFAGIDADRHRAAFALLHARYIGPEIWRPAMRAPCVVPLADSPTAVDLRRAALGLPPLLRSYLAMGGWVSDHAVRDIELGTLHVFTGLEIDAIPPARARALRAVAE